MPKPSRYQSDPVYRAKVKARSKARYHSLTPEQRKEEQRKREARYTPEQFREWDKDRRRRNAEKLKAECRGNKLLFKFETACAELRKRKGKAAEEFYRKRCAETEFSCEICGHELKTSSDFRMLHLDHDHSTGEFRGVLCHNCNVALGLVRDRIDTLEKMVAYLKRPSV